MFRFSGSGVDYVVDSWKPIDFPLGWESAFYSDLLTGHYFLSFLETIYFYENLEGASSFM